MGGLLIVSPELCRLIKSFWLLRVFLIDGHGLGMFLLLGYLPQEVAPTGPLPTIYCKTLADILVSVFILDAGWKGSIKQGLSS